MQLFFHRCGKRVYARLASDSGATMATGPHCRTQGEAFLALLRQEPRSFGIYRIFNLSPKRRVTKE